MANNLRGNTRIALESAVITNFERMLRGATPDHFESITDYHIPISVLSGETSIKEANKIRRNLGHIIVAPLIFSPDPNMDTIVAISLEDVDPVTRATVKDPQVLGVWDEQNGITREIEGKGLTKKFYRALKEGAERLPQYSKEHPWTYVRDGKSYVETETPGEPEKE